MIFRAMQLIEMGAPYIFHHACTQDHVPMVQHLYQSNVTKDPYSISQMLLNHRDGTGATGMSWAARNGHATLVEYLLQKGADKDIADKEATKTPLQYSSTPVIVNL